MHLQHRGEWARDFVPVARSCWSSSLNGRRKTVPVFVALTASASAGRALREIDDGVSYFNARVAVWGA